MVLLSMPADLSTGLIAGDSHRRCHHFRISGLMLADRTMLVIGVVTQASKYNPSYEGLGFEAPATVQFDKMRSVPSVIRV